MIDKPESIDVRVTALEIAVERFEAQLQVATDRDIPVLKGLIRARTDEPIVSVDDSTLLDLDVVDGVVLSGSTANVSEDIYDDWLESAKHPVEECLETRVPLLGICFGHQVVNVGLRDTVEQDRRRATFVEMEQAGDGVLDGVDSVVQVSHTDLEEEMVPTATTDYNEFYYFRHVDAPLWAVQFPTSSPSWLHTARVTSTLGGTSSRTTMRHASWRTSNESM